MIVGVEVGKKKAFAASLEWPGWCRSARGEKEAIETLLAYAGRYAPIARAAGEDFAPDTSAVRVVERVEGNATTDFGAPGARYRFDDEHVGPGELARAGRLLEAAYAYLDDVAASAPAELRKGPRGGGRDRDAVVAHVVAADVEYGRKLGLERWKPETATVTEVASRRRALVSVFETAASGEPRHATGWPLRYAARRGIWHVLDHAWEIEDRSEP